MPLVTLKPVLRGPNGLEGQPLPMGHEPFFGQASAWPSGLMQETLTLLGTIRRLLGHPCSQSCPTAVYVALLASVFSVTYPVPLPTSDMYNRM